MELGATVSVCEVDGGEDVPRLSPLRSVLPRLLQPITVSGMMASQKQVVMTLVVLFIPQGDPPRPISSEVGSFCNMGRRGAIRNETPMERILLE